jgi:molybdopterin synthase catalytic subunit
MSDGNANRIDCRLQVDPIVPTELRAALPRLPECGGYVCFEGVIRNANHGKAVVRLDYEAYEELAQKELTRIAEFAAERFGLRYVSAVHRRGRLEIGDTAVMIQVLSRHRREAFEGCRYVIDQLKARVPIWKREHYEDGSSTWTMCHEHEPPLMLDR